MLAVAQPVQAAGFYISEVGTPGSLGTAGVTYVDLSRKTRGYSVGFSYDSSPVRNRDRTIDLPFDENYKLSAAYGWHASEHLDFAAGGILM